MLTVVGMALATVLALAIPASAHEIVQLDQSDRNPLVAPLIVDGTDPIGWFGVIPTGGDVRSFQVRLQAGQPLEVIVTIPDLAPENTLATADLPRVHVITPNGSVTQLTPNIRVPFREQGRNADLLFIREYSTTAPATGAYSFVVTSRAPARFLISTGVEEGIEEDFHGILRGSLATDEQFQAWYATAP
jgi:hypothetical protein